MPQLTGARSGLVPKHVNHMVMAMAGKASINIFLSIEFGGAAINQYTKSNTISALAMPQRSAAQSIEIMNRLWQRVVVWGNSSSTKNAKQMCGHKKVLKKRERCPLPQRLWAFVALSSGMWSGMAWRGMRSADCLK